MWGMAEIEQNHEKGSFLAKVDAASTLHVYQNTYLLNYPNFRASVFLATEKLRLDGEIANYPEELNVQVTGTDHPNGQLRPDVCVEVAVGETHTLAIFLGGRGVFSTSAVGNSIENAYIATMENIGSFRRLQSIRVCYLDDERSCLSAEIFTYPYPVLMMQHTHKWGHMPGYLHGVQTILCGKLQNRKDWREFIALFDTRNREVAIGFDPIRSLHTNAVPWWVGVTLPDIGREDNEV